MVLQKGSVQAAWMNEKETVEVMQALGDDARFVGGCVRDSLANRPTCDIDIATSLTPAQVKERLAEHDIICIDTGIKYGTVTAIVGDGKPFEITTLREDVETDGRHAKVKFIDDWEKDASRRDFTINAMSANLQGEVFDYFGGMEDLRTGIVRFVGDAKTRVEEDYLRILRYFRFYKSFERGDPNKDALEACRLGAKGILGLTPERIGQEMSKFLKMDDIAGTWKLMLESNVVQNFLPEATNVEKLEKLEKLEKEYENQSDTVRKLAALVVKTDGVKDKLKLSNYQAEQLEKMFNKHSAISIKNTEKIDIRKLVYKEGNDMARSLLLLAAANTDDTSGLKELYNEATVFREPLLPIQGKDVLALGVKEGKDVGVLLHCVEDWWVDEDFKPKRKECLDQLKEYASPAIA